MDEKEKKEWRKQEAMGGKVDNKSQVRRCVLLSKCGKWGKRGVGLVCAASKEIILRVGWLLSS